MPGRSAAPSRTVDRMIASCASLVGCLSVSMMPRAILVLALHAHRSRAPIDRVCRYELESATSAREAASPVYVELLDESTAPAARVAVIAKARAARLDRFAEDSDNRVPEQQGFLQRD